MRRRAKRANQPRGPILYGTALRCISFPTLYCAVLYIVIIMINAIEADALFPFKYGKALVSDLFRRAFGKELSIRRLFDCSRRVLSFLFVSFRFVSFFD